MLAREDIGRLLNVSLTYLGKPLDTQQLGKVFVGADGARLVSVQQCCSKPHQPDELASRPAAEGFYDALAVPTARQVARMPDHR